MNQELSQMTCEPCRGGIPPLKGDELTAWHQKLGSQWDLIDDHHLSRTFEFGSFKDSMLFSQKIGDLAEEVGHHPEIHISFKKVTLELWTHKIDGLADADFIWAAKADSLFESLK